MLLRSILGLALVLAASSAWSADKVKLRQGTPVSGTIVQMSPDEVEVEQGPISKKIPVHEILSIEYDEEPTGLDNLVRAAYEGGRYAEALAAVEKIDAAEVKRSEVKQDLAFYKAASAARLALGGSGDLREAGKLLVALEANAPGSYHYLEVCELLGDLLVINGNHVAAQKYYDKIANSSSPEYKLKAGVLVARSLEAQKEFEKAIAKYDEVINGLGDSPDAAVQKQIATCGKARAMAETGKAEEAIEMVKAVIAAADEDATELHARAYNALGSCYLSAGKKQDALLAYLHTDLLFAGYAEQHAEALAALSTLWAESDKLDRAQEAKATLEQRYPGSRWARSK